MPKRSAPRISPDDKLLTADEAAALLRMSRASLYRATADGTIRYVRNPITHRRLFLRSELLARLGKG